MIITEVQITQTGPPGPRTVTGLIEAGAGIMLEGDGTPASPLVIAATGGGGGGGSGTVESVAMTVPTGLVVTGSPVTTSGTLAVALAAGHIIPTQAELDGKAASSHTHTLAQVANLDEVIEYDALSQTWTFSPDDINARDCSFESVTFNSGVDGEGGDVFFNCANYSYGSTAKAAAHRDALGLQNIAYVTHASGGLTIDGTNCAPKVIRSTGADAYDITYTPDQPTGRHWIIRQVGAGVGTVLDPAGGSRNGDRYKTAGQHTLMSVEHVGANVLDFEGGVA